MISDAEHGFPQTMTTLFLEFQDSLYTGAENYGYGVERFTRALEQAIWRGDTDALDELAHCRCCCHQHTFEFCPARVWGGCRGQYTMTHAEEQAWVKHYQHFHGMTEAEFFDDGDDE